MTDDDVAYYRSVFIAALVVAIIGALFESLGAQSVELRDTAKARAIVQRHIAAIGGEAALRASKPTHLVMTMSRSGSPAVIRMESWQSAPRLYTRMETPGLGVTEVGFDGKTAWTISPQLGAMILGDLPEEMIGPRDLTAELRQHPMAYDGVRDIGGKKYDVVVFTVNGATSTAYYDPKSGLMAGMTPEKSPGPPGHMSMTFDQWKRFGPIRYATRLTARTADGKEETVTRIESISYDPIDPARFELPAKVHELKARNQPPM